MRTLVLGLLLFVIFGLFSTRIQNRLREAFQARPVLLIAVPLALWALFCAAAAGVGAFSLPLAALVLGYLAIPTAVAWAQGPARVKRGSWADLAAILLLWLPLEFAAGAGLVPRPAQGFLHSVAYGIAIVLALVLFLGFRALEGMKYRVPAARDLGVGAAGFALTAPVLIAVGLAIQFIPAAHLPVHASAGRALTTFLVILAGTAIPEEILFRSLLQNWIEQRLGLTWKALLLAGFVFGCAHLDNGPQPLPNWRYMILATIAGVAYGQVFRKSSSVFSSSLFHALVDTTKHLFF